MIDSIAEDAGAGQDLKRSRRRKVPLFDATKLDRLPPHSTEAEQGVLGCILWQQSCLSECATRMNGTEPHFYDLRHQTIYDAAASMFKKHEHLDLITLQQRLKDGQMLDQVGGIAYLSSLQDSVPSAANLSYYLDILLEKSRLRKLIRTCSDIVSRAYDFEGEVDELIDSAEVEIVRISQSRSQSSGEAWDIGDLAGYNTTNDPNCVIGFRNGKSLRFLCSGYGAWVVGPSGIGKSSLMLQMAVLWSIGQDFCGIGPGGRKLRILYTQAENDVGDASEQVQGVLASLGIDEFNSPELFATVRQNVKVMTQHNKVGASFVKWLEQEIIKHAADVVIVDPLLSFAGIDISRQDQCSNFLRAVLNPVLKSTGVVMIGAHHTTKPKEKKATEGFTSYDFSYAGQGSSELTNWARAIAVLSPLEAGKFQLMITKRGRRSGACHANGEPTTTLYLQHAHQGINWEQVDPPAEAEPADKKAGQPSKVQKVLELGLGMVIDTLTGVVGKNDLARKIESFAATKGLDVSLDTCKRVVEKLVSNGAIKKGDGGYIRA